MSEKKKPIKTSDFLENLLKKMLFLKLIEIRTENNIHLKVSYKGCSSLFISKWNIKIYNTGSVVCTDIVSLRKYALGKLGPPDPSLKLVKIDDSGGGFPLCGILLGVEVNDIVYTAEVGVEYFKPGIFERKEYLKKYSDEGIKLLTQKLHVNPKTHRIEICSGFVNSTLRESLQKLCFDVRVVEIKGLLQDSLENYFKNYVEKETGVDLAYDPKEITEQKLVFQYNKALQWGIKNAPHLLKSGWKKMIDNGITG